MQSEEHHISLHQRRWRAEAEPNPHAACLSTSPSSLGLPLHSSIHSPWSASTTPPTAPSAPSPCPADSRVPPPPGFVGAAREAAKVRLPTARAHTARREDHGAAGQRAQAQARVGDGVCVSPPALFPILPPSRCSPFPPTLPAPAFLPPPRPPLPARPRPAAPLTQPRQVPPHAGHHALLLRVGRADLQPRHDLHAAHRAHLRDRGHPAW
jgi:hypothetical protein